MQLSFEKCDPVGHFTSVNVIRETHSLVQENSIGGI